MFRELLAREFAPYGALSETQLSQLEAHYALLVRWNPRLNLTRIIDVEDAVKFHYCESLFLGASLPPGELRIVDVGSGGGFPGIPVAILRPNCQVTLVESHQRKAVFLREASRDLPNVKVFAGRAEDHSGTFDWVVSRAVAPSDVLRLSLAPRFALLIGDADAHSLEGSKTAMPWGEHRILFHVEPRSQSSTWNENRW